MLGLQEIEGGKEKTFQMDGNVRHLEKDTDLVKIYLEKFPNKAAKYEHDVFLSMIPKWWRFTDWSKPEGKTIYMSDGKVFVKGNLLKI